MALEAAGYNPELVNTAASAQQRIESLKYELVISDWWLADGGDGMIVVGQAADRGIKTMLISGYLFLLTEPDKRHEYLMKPMRPSELLAAVKRLIGPA